VYQTPTARFIASHVLYRRQPDFTGLFGALVLPEGGGLFFLGGSMRWRLKYVGLMSVLLLCLVGCSLRVRDADLSGTYHATADWGTSTLVLRPDHTFGQSVSTNSGTFRKVQGTWELDTSGTSQSITLAGKYLSVTHDKQGEEADIAFASVERRLFGGAEISSDPDYGIAFQK
jgi:hypothetical protein